jgi:hypothetical protein
LSFDLCIVHLNDALTYEQARDLYWRLCDGDWAPAESIPAVALFYGELTALYPEIDETPESEISACPWTCRHDKSGKHVIVAIRWDRVEEVVPVVKRLAKKYGLACLDPQNQLIDLPDLSRSM